MKNAIETRRSIYNLGNEQVLSSNDIIKLVEHSVKYCPSAFNSQTARVVVLFGENHNKLWDIVLDTIKKIVPEKAFLKTLHKIDTSFKSGYGTILYFEDQDIVRDLQEQFPSYSDNFPIWSEQSSGMLQFTIWTSLAEAGVGASLQHYNPIIDNQVKETWNLPNSWKLIAQMPFGRVEKPADPKEFAPIENRVKVFK